MSPHIVRAIRTIALLLALLGSLGVPSLTAAQPETGFLQETRFLSATSTSATIPQVAIVVDGVVDAAYGSPIAADPSGDGHGNSNMDLLNLYVTEDAANLYVAFTIDANIGATNWGKYVLYIDTTNDANGATSDAWTRNVAVNYPHKPEYGIYTWVNDLPYGPARTQLVHWTGSAWDWPGVRQVAAGAIGAGTPSVIEWQVSKADLGNPDAIWVEVWDTGGGSSDNAQDTINNPADDWNAADWSTQSQLSCSTYYDILMASLPGADNNIWWDGLEHDSRRDLYRVPFGAVPKNTPLTLRFRTYAGDVTGVQLRVWDTAQETQTLHPMIPVAVIPGDPLDYQVWQVELTAPDYETILYYRFVVTDGSDIDYYEDDDLFDGGLGQAYDSSPDYSWQIDVYDPAFDTPDWFKNAVVYQIFPDRFRSGLDANDPISGTFFYDETPGVLTAPQWNTILPDPRVAGPWAESYSKLFYGGDLQGIIDQLDYLQDLGVTTLYLNPIFESPSNHKYDTADYEQIDNNFGDLATFQALASELHGRGMHLVLDGVFNHTSSDSRYFDRYGRYPEVGACESVTSPYRSWYYFTPASTPGSGACDGDTDYTAWWGFNSLPKLNTTDGPDVRSYIYSDTPPIAAYWLQQGADGWRLDVAGDVAPSFWQAWRPYIRAAKTGAVTIAEEWGDASRFILCD
jgi:Alpha amylase, catalytic domain